MRHEGIPALTGAHVSLCWSVRGLRQGYNLRSGSTSKCLMDMHDSCRQGEFLVYAMQSRSGKGVRAATGLTGFRSPCTQPHSCRSASPASICRIQACSRLRGICNISSPAVRDHALSGVQFLTVLVSTPSNRCDRQALIKDGNRVHHSHISHSHISLLKPTKSCKAKTGSPGCRL